MAPEVRIDATLVRALLAQQHPDLADLPLAEVGGGWDNHMFRLGERWAVRLPCRAVSAALVEREHRWLARLSSDLPLAIPVPHRTGSPGQGFPWAWSVVPWFPGESLLAARLPELPSISSTLGRFLDALHRPAPGDAPPNPWRGVPLAGRTPILRANLEQVGQAVDREAALRFWNLALAAPPWPGPPVWIHGDLHPGNLIVADGRLSAVIDFGDLTAGDPATDWAIAWMLPASIAAALRSAAIARPHQIDPHMWMRARGWALALGLAYIAGSPAGDPLIALGHATIRAALADER